MPPRLKGSGELVGLNASHLEELLVHFSKIRGRLFSQINFSNDPRIELHGSIQLKDGQIRDFAFLKWLSESFSMDNVIQIDFQKASTAFSVTDEGAGIQDIWLEAKDVKIQGFFQVDQRSLVSSVLSLSFSRPFLQESPKLRPVVRMLDPQEDLYDFLFRLSGNQHAMNFQWIDSPVKSAIAQRVPDFIERIIERKIDRQTAGSTPPPAAGEELER
jgi:hypothetical protein